jgi:hypothetical protein
MASPELACVVGEVTGPPSQKKALLLEALQKALENAPPPSSGADIQNFRVVSVELEHGGFTGATRTRVTLEFNDGPLD